MKPVFVCSTVILTAIGFGSGLAAAHLQHDGENHPDYATQQAPAAGPLTHAKSEFSFTAHAPLEMAAPLFGPEADARMRMANTLRRSAAHNGRPDRYPHTRTLAWMQLVSAATRTTPAIQSFEEFIAAHPHLSDQETILQHYSKERLDSPDARKDWIGPDLQSLPVFESGMKSVDVS